MVIDDENEIFFIHIPKNAGTFIRTNLKDGREFWGLRTFPEIGKRDAAHLTLEEIRQALPQVFEKLIAYESFALIREPRERFVSSVLEAARDYHNTPKSAVSDEQIVELGEHYLSRLPNRGVEFAHFTPQIDFVRLDGKPMIDNLFRLEDIDRCVAVLEQRVGRKFDDAKVNTSPKKGNTVASEGWRLLTRIAPQLRSTAGGKRISAKLEGRTLSLPSDLEKKVLDFYAEDLDLYNAL